VDWLHDCYFAAVGGDVVFLLRLGQVS
jgi:hypothetical protein